MKHQTLEIMDNILNVEEKITNRAIGLRAQVMDIRVEKNTITAMVSSATKNTLVYEVSIHLDARRRKCSCEAHKRYRNTPCKHTVAVAMVVRDLLTLME